MHAQPQNSQSPQRLAILGSTGSIGRQSLEVVRELPGHFAVEVLAAHRNWELLAQQAIEFMPDSVVIADPAFYAPLKERLSSLPVKVYAGAEALGQVVRGEGVDVVISALVGFAGLAPTLAAVQAGKKVALANKESLVVAGELVIAAARQSGAPILPVDSEHSAIFQSIVGEPSPLRRVILTASGGALRDLPLDQLCRVTPAQALQHPNWTMGPKITIDSATMVNKGFEVIEARWLFGLTPDQIDVVIHPQSIIHSFVEFEDGALKAQLGTPDMKLPIRYALTFPHRFPARGERYDPCQGGTLTFCSPDPDRYPCLELAYEALRAGGGAPCILNAANEVAVARFLSGSIPFTAIHTLLARTLDALPAAAPASLDHYRALDAEARHFATTLIP